MTQKLLFRRGNLVGDDHPLPSVAEVWLSVTCNIPSSIVLIADEPGMHFFRIKVIDYKRVVFYYLSVSLVIRS